MFVHSVIVSDGPTATNRARVSFWFVPTGENDAVLVRTRFFDVDAGRIERDAAAAASVPVAATPSNSWFAVTRTQRAGFPNVSVFLRVLSSAVTVPASVKPSVADVVDVANVTRRERIGVFVLAAHVAPRTAAIVAAPGSSNVNTYGAFASSGSSVPMPMRGVAEVPVVHAVERAGA